MLHPVQTFAVLLLLALVRAPAPSMEFHFTASSYLGEAGHEDWVAGACIQSDGTICLSFHEPRFWYKRPNLAMSRVDILNLYAGCSDLSASCEDWQSDSEKSCISIGSAISSSNASKMFLPVSCEKMVPSALKSQLL